MSTNKRYPLTIPADLDRDCKNFVEGDRHYRGSRNQFFIEAIEEKLERCLNGDSSAKPPSMQKKQEESPAEAPPVPQPARKPNRAPLLAWVDGMIKDVGGNEYRVVSAPRPNDGESPEDYFNRIKEVPGVSFVKIVNPLQEPAAPPKSPLSSPLVMGDGN